MIRTNTEANKQNIILTGFMGCGKTSAGKAAAGLLGMCFLDIDSEIERAEGMAIPDIFKERGEGYFREAESGVVRRLAEEGITDTVVATGGGIVKNPENMRLLREMGLIVYLSASPEKLLANIGKTGQHKRPLLDVPDPEGEIGRLLKEREPLYRGFCDVIVDCGLLDVDETVRKIVEIWKDLRNWFL